MKTIRIISLLFFLFILWVIYLANTGNNSVFFDLVKSLPFGDKIGHFLLFGSLNFIGILSLKFKTLSFKAIKIYKATLFIILFVLIEEISQNFIDNRTFDLVDLTADFIGIIFSSYLVKLLKNNFLKTKVSN